MSWIKLEDREPSFNTEVLICYECGVLSSKVKKVYSYKMVEVREEAGEKFYMCLNDTHSSGGSQGREIYTSSKGVAFRRTRTYIPVEQIVAWYDVPSPFPAKIKKLQTDKEFDFSNLDI